MNKLKKLLTLGLVGVSALSGGAMLAGCNQTKDDEPQVNAGEVLERVVSSYANKDFIVTWEESDDEEAYTEYFDCDTKIKKRIRTNLSGQQLGEYYYWESNGFMYTYEDYDSKTHLEREDWNFYICYAFTYTYYTFNEDNQIGYSKNDKGNYVCNVTIEEPDGTIYCKWEYNDSQILDVVVSVDDWSMDYDFNYNIPVDLAIPAEYKQKEKDANIEQLGSLSMMYYDADMESFDFVATANDGGVYKYDSTNTIGYYKKGDYEMYAWAENFGNNKVVDSDGKTIGLVGVDNLFGFFGAYKSLYGSGVTRDAYIDFNGNIVQTIVDGDTTSIYTYSAERLIKVTNITSSATVEYTFDYSNRVELTVPDSYKELVS